MEYKVYVPTFKKWCEQRELRDDQEGLVQPNCFSKGEDEKISKCQQDKMPEKHSFSAMLGDVHRVKNKEIILEFSRGAYFSGSLEYAIRKFEGRYYFYNLCTNKFLWMQNYFFEISGKELIQLDKILKKAKNWIEKYKPDSDYLDGYGWLLEYHGSHIDIKSSGYMAFPENYSEVSVDLQVYMEELCRKYVDDYTEEGIEERLRL